MGGLEIADTPIETETFMASVDDDGLAEPANELAAAGIITTTDEAASAMIEADPGAEVVTRCCSSLSTSSYTAQFLEMQSFILSRIKENELLARGSTAPTLSNAAQADLGNEGEQLRSHPFGGGGGGGGGGELPTRLGETLAMPTPTSSGEEMLSAAARIDAANSYRLRLKRKRDKEEVDFTQSTISFPVSAPKPAPARLEISSKVEQDAVDHEDDEDGDEDKGMHDVVEELEKLRSRNLAALPHGVFPAKAELVGFPAGQASDLALTEYFYGKKRTDLLNILSFADQLRPQLLVDVLVSVSRKHRDLPIFDSPRRNAEAPSAAPLNLKLAHKENLHHHHRRRHAHPHQHTKPRHGHVILVSDAKARTHKHNNNNNNTNNSTNSNSNKSTTSRKIVKLHTSASAGETPPILPLLDNVNVNVNVDDNDNDDDDDDDDENRDSLPPTWPKAGEGLYAKLTAEDQDRTLLLDENDEEAFSHFAVDRYGKQMALLLPACG